MAKLFYNTKVNLPDKLIHAVDKNILLVSELLNCSPDIEIAPLPVVEKYSKSLELKLSEAGIKKDDKCVGIIPVARWESKCWPPEFFAEIIQKCSEKRPELKYLIIGSPADSEISNKIIELCPEEIRSNITSFAGKTNIGELVEIIRRCSASVANDSGPMHIAAALKVPFTALFGPTDPLKTGPYGAEDSVFQADLSCIKCLKRYCQKDTYDCHKAINTEMVSKKILEDMDNYEK